ncbi:hypothetical protein LTR49_028354, partial [Elasticomyces elasticus]
MITPIRQGIHGSIYQRGSKRLQGIRRLWYQFKWDTRINQAQSGGITCLASRFEALIRTNISGLSTSDVTPDNATKNSPEAAGDPPLMQPWR